MKKAVIDAIEKALARKQKQLARIEYEIDIWTNGYSYLTDAYSKIMTKLKNKKINFRGKRQMLESYHKESEKINKILLKDSTKLFDKKFRLEDEIRELEDELWRLNLKRYV